MRWRLRRPWTGALEPLRGCAPWADRRVAKGPTPGGRHPTATRGRFRRCAPGFISQVVRAVQVASRGRWRSPKNRQDKRHNLDFPSVLCPKGKGPPRWGGPFLIPPYAIFTSDEAADGMAFSRRSSVLGFYVGKDRGVLRE